MAKETAKAAATVTHYPAAVLWTTPYASSVGIWARRSARDVRSFDTGKCESFSFEFPKFYLFILHNCIAHSCRVNDLPFIISFYFVFKFCL